MCYGCGAQSFLRINVDSSDIIILHLEMNKVLYKHIELPDYFLRSNKSNINQMQGLLEFVPS